MVTIIENRFTATFDSKFNKALKVLDNLDKGVITVDIQVDDGKLKKTKDMMTQIIELEKKKYIAEQKGYKNTSKLLDKYLSQVRTGKELNEAQIANYDLVMTKEKMTLNAKIKSEEEKRKVTRETGNEQVRIADQIQKLELKVMSAGLSKKHKMEVQALKKRKNVTISEVKNMQKKIDTILAKKAGRRSGFAESFTDFMVFREVAQTMTRMMGDSARLEDAIFQMGIVGGKTVGEIRGLRGEMHKLGSEIPRMTEEIVTQITAIERTGRTYREAMNIMRGATKLSISSGK